MKIIQVIKIKRKKENYHILEGIFINKAEMDH